MVVVVWDENVLGVLDVEWEKQKWEMRIFSLYAYVWDEREVEKEGRRAKVEMKELAS